MQRRPGKIGHPDEDLNEDEDLPSDQEPDEHPALHSLDTCRNP
jgi:hypothetical protein